MKQLAILATICVVLWGCSSAPKPRYAADQKAAVAKPAAATPKATYTATERAGGCADAAKDGYAAIHEDWKSEYAEAYNAATKGLSLNKACRNRSKRLVNAAMLLTGKGWAERDLGFQTQAWMDMKEAERLLQQCIDTSADRANNDSGDCAETRSENEMMLKEWSYQDNG